MKSVEQLTSIRYADPAEWDVLAGDELFWRHGWVSTLEEFSNPPISARYFVIRDGSGISAAAVCQAQDRSESAAGIDRVLFGRLAPLAHAMRLGVSPLLVCGMRVGIASHVRVRPDVAPQERKQTVDAIMRAMQDSARAEGRTLCFRNVRKEETELEGLLKEGGFTKAAEMPYTVLNIEWGTFTGYIRNLKQAHPATAKNISHETNRLRSRGVAIRRLEHPGAFTPRLHQLLRNHNLRLNGADFPFDESFVSKLCERLGDSVVLFTAFSGDLPIGLTIAIRDRYSMYLPFIGIDHERRKDSLAYFHLAYNEPIRYAIENGIRAFYCGKLLYDLKFRRGFRQVPLHMYLRMPDPIRHAMIRPVAASQKARVSSMVGIREARHSAADNPA